LFREFPLSSFTKELSAPGDILYHAKDNLLLERQQAKESLRSVEVSEAV
jgi:hypothetical protein